MDNTLIIMLYILLDQLMAKYKKFQLLYFNI